VLASMVGDFLAGIDGGQGATGDTALGREL